MRTDLAQGPLLATPPCSSILTLAVPGSCRAFTGSYRAFTGSSRAFTGSCKAFTGSYRAWPLWALLGHRESLAGRSTTCSCSHLLPISFFLVHLLSFSNSSRPARGFRAMQWHPCPADPPSHPKSSPRCPQLSWVPACFAPFFFPREAFWLTAFCTTTRLWLLGFLSKQHSTIPNYRPGWGRTATG